MEAGGCQATLGTVTLRLRRLIGLTCTVRTQPELTLTPTPTPTLTPTLTLTLILTLALTPTRSARSPSAPRPPAAPRVTGRIGGKVIRDDDDADEHDGEDAECHVGELHARAAHLGLGSGLE